MQECSPSRSSCGKNIASSSQIKFRKAAKSIRKAQTSRKTTIKTIKTTGAKDPEATKNISKAGTSGIKTIKTTSAKVSKATKDRSTAGPSGVLTIKPIMIKTTYNHREFATPKTVPQPCPPKSAPPAHLLKAKQVAPVPAPTQEQLRHFKACNWG